MNKGRNIAKALRVALPAGAAAVALAFADSALATPRLIIGGSTAPGTSRVSFELLEEKSDAAPAKLVVYAPAGYTGKVTAAPGTQLGTIHADFLALEVAPDAITSADGQVLATEPAQRTANACSPGVHAAVWLLRFTVNGQTAEFPAYVDLPVPATDPVAGKSPFRVTVCFPSPYVPAAQGGAPFGIKLIDAKVQLNQGIFRTPSARGSYAWRAVITPYTVGSANPNAAGTVEARGIVDLPDVLSIAVTLTDKSKRMVRITGGLRAGRFPLVGATVLLTGSAKGKKRTGSGGKVRFSLRLKRKGTYTFRLRSTVPAYDVTADGCKTPTSPTLRCVSASANGFTATSRAVTLTVS
jgi:hypothetical protein